MTTDPEGLKQKFDTYRAVNPEILGLGFALLDVFFDPFAEIPGNQ